jgi:hypothetical protein
MKELRIILLDLDAYSKVRQAIQNGGIGVKKVRV